MLKYATRKAIKYFIFKYARLQLKAVKNAHQIALLKSCLKPCEYCLLAFEIVQECNVCLCEQRYKYICLIKQKKTDSNLAFESVLIGWGTRIRTQTYRVRVCCATVTQFPNIFCDTNYSILYLLCQGEILKMFTLKYHSKCNLAFIAPLNFS